jgi:hypothetical protein
VKVMHRTPTHLELLSAVKAGLVEFRPDEGVAGRFARRGGEVVSDPPQLIALYELKEAGLIRVEGSAVALTVDGLAKLTGWSVIR